MLSEFKFLIIMCQILSTMDQNSILGIHYSMAKFYGWSCYVIEKNIQMRKKSGFSRIITSQKGMLAFHWPVSVHVIADEPSSEKPSSQRNSTMLPNELVVSCNI